MSTSLDISIDTAKAPVVSTGVSEQMRAINVDTSASSVLDEPRQTGDGSDTQIQSKLGAATVAATAAVPAVGAAAFGESATLAAAIVTGKGNVHRLRGGASPDTPDGSRSRARVSRASHPARVVGGEEL
ncbi:TPA: hypothetical protein ACH3X1_010240 [Trebouxia sp. C0004]